MAARSIGSGTISFGLVSIPVRLYVATSTRQLSFNMLHRECGTRIKQQLWCPKDERIVERSEIVKGFEFQKDRYVTFTDEELKALEAEANRSIDIQEFVPLATVDPVYFENTHYLGPDKGAEKAYHLLAETMRDTEKVALAQFVHHGKEHLVVIRPYEKGLALHSMYYADEVRSFSEVGIPSSPALRAGESDLARKLVEQLSTEEFHPERYKDEYRDRVQEVVEKKVAGEEVTAAAPEPARAQVIDLMDALKASLSRRGAATASERRAGADEPAGRRRPAAPVRGRSAQTGRRRVRK
jgi:DNA end-binding protein Ku